MTKDWLRYDEMVEDALRGVVRRALAEVKRGGLPGEHHFYITFRTDADETAIPSTLKTQYPREITIVLQHQFWDLEVHEDYFAVTLSFGGRQERLKVPFAAIVSFADPSVKFALQFDTGEGPQEMEGEPATQASGAQSGNAQSGNAQPGSVRPGGVRPGGVQADGTKTPPALEKPEAKPALADQRAESEPPAEAAEKDAAKSGATIVALDSFRKKH